MSCFISFMFVSPVLLCYPRLLSLQIASLPPLVCFPSFFDRLPRPDCPHLCLVKSPPHKGILFVSCISLCQFLVPFVCLVFQLVLGVFFGVFSDSSSALSLLDLFPFTGWLLVYRTLFFSKLRLEFLNQELSTEACIESCLTRFTSCNTTVLANKARSSRCFLKMHPFLSWQCWLVRGCVGKTW